MTMRNVQGALAGLTLMIVAAQTGWSQTADLSGIVKDKSGAVVPSAAVSVMNENTGIVRSTISNDEGVFLVPVLNPGSYKVTVSATGFQPVARTGVVLNVGDRFALDFVLDVGEISTEVTVTAETTPMWQTATSVGTVINHQFVDALPLNGRSFQSLILVTPGVSFITASSLELGHFSVNGQRGSANYFTIDGVSANIGIGFHYASAANAALSGAYPGLNTMGGTNGLVSMDALEEFKIETSTYTAERGRQPGGQISLVTRSGTNAYHGTLSEYLRNDVLDARNFFNHQVTCVVGACTMERKPKLRQNIFGGTFGGPILKNKTFFFFSYEGMRLRLPQVGETAVPSLRVRSAAAAAVKPFLNAFPLPTGPETYWDDDEDPTTPNVLSGWAPMHYNISNPSNSDAIGIRVDHNFSSKLHVSGRYNESPSESTDFLYNVGPSGTGIVASTRTLTLGADSQLTARLHNEFRFNWSRQLGQNRYVGANYGGAVPVDQALLTNGLPGWGWVGFSFGSSLGVLQGGDVTKNYQRQINIVDNISLVKEPHLFKFGVDYRRLSPTLGPGDRQTISFGTEDDINDAIASSVTITSIGTARPRYDNWSLYAQDTWKPASRLTLDFGIRWEVNPAPKEADGKYPPVLLGITIDNDGYPDVSKAALAPAGTPFYKTFYAAFAPRLGTAYMLRGSSGHETVLRGGFGVYYDLGSGTATSGFPMAAIKSPMFGVPFPLSAASAARPPITPPTTLPLKNYAYSTAQDLRLPYTLQWSIGLQQSLGRQQTVLVSYVASAARRLLTQQDVNRPTKLSTGPRPNPNFSDIFYSWNGSTSDYNSMQVQYTARFTSRLQALVNYTWAHAIDEVSTDILGTTLSRGNANFDVRHNFSTALTHNLPKPGGNPFVTRVFGSWSLDGIVHAQTGRPVDINWGGTIYNGMVTWLRPDVVSGRPFYLYDPTVPGHRRFNAAAFKSPPLDPNTGIMRQGSLGRNVLRELALYQFDLALGRRFTIKEGVNLQFKGELFNLFNHPMFGNYSNSPGSDFGVPRTTLNVGTPTTGQSQLYAMGGPRSVQFSLKISF